MVALVKRLDFTTVQSRRMEFAAGSAKRLLFNRAE
jgi:hypothetical protein